MTYLIPAKPPIRQKAAMDHRYIDEHAVAARYIENALTAEEHVAFEAHMIDCQDCTDRVLLAGIFHARKPSEPEFPHARDLPLRARFAARMGPWQLLLIFTITALLLLAIPALLIPVFLR